MSTAMSDTMHVVLPVPQHLALSTAMSSKLVCCDMRHVCVPNRLCTSLYMCVTFLTLVLSAESSTEKERGEFSMLSTVDMCAACSAVPSGQYWRSRGQTNNMLSFY